MSVYYHVDPEGDTEETDRGYVVPDQEVELCANLQPIGYQHDHSNPISLDISKDEYNELINCVYVAAPLLYPQRAAQIIYNILSGEWCQ